MVTASFVWNVCKSSLTFGLIGLTISDRVASIVPVRGFSMSPTFNPDKTTYLGLFTGRFLINLEKTYTLLTTQFGCASLINSVY